MKKSEAFRLGMLFKGQSKACLEHNTETGLLSNPSYPVEIQDLARVLCTFDGVPAKVVHAERLICNKLDKEPLNVERLEELLLLVIEGQRFKMLMFTPVDKCDTDLLEASQVRDKWLVTYDKLIGKSEKVIKPSMLCVKCGKVVTAKTIWEFSVPWLEKDIRPLCADCHTTLEESADEFIGLV